MSKGDVNKFWEGASVVTPSRQMAFMEAMIESHEHILKINKSKTVVRIQPCIKVCPRSHVLLFASVADVAVVAVVDGSATLVAAAAAARARGGSPGGIAAAC